jgi:hypothetical protein
MTSNFVSRTVLIFVLLVQGQAAFGQQDSQSKPLGDVAREQRQQRTQKKRAGTAKHVVKRIGTPPPSSADPKSVQNAVPPAAQPSDQVSESSDAETVSTPEARRPQEPDVLVVPAGTEIRVETLAGLPTVTRSGTFYEGKVVVPVRIGFTTAIPALSKVKIAVYSVYAGNGYIVYGNSLFSPTGYADSSGYINQAELDSVTIDGTEYKVRTKGAPFSASSEQQFVLEEPLTLER